MEKFILPALISNTACLSLHWIYDAKYLEGLSLKESLLFRAYDDKDYKASSLSFNAYPNSQIGDLSVQGQIMVWLYKALKENSDFSKEDYSLMLYDQFKPGGLYTGYVESYALKHVVSILQDNLKIDKTDLVVMDDHLVGFMPYIVCKSLGLDSNRAFEYTSVYSKDPDYLTYFKMFDALLLALKAKPLKQALKDVIHAGPSKYKLQLEKAVSMTDTFQFINTYSSTACAIKDSIPLIVHILANTSSFESALSLNVVIGGASADRASLIGTVYGEVSGIPKTWTDLTKNLFNL